MKKMRIAALTAVLALALCGCGQNTDVTTEKPSQSGAVSSETIQPVDNKEEDDGKTADGVDIDLSEMSSTVAYSQIYTMIYSPEEYIGKTVRMKGNFTIYHALDENGNVIEDSMYFACAVADATACCAQGLEFVLGGGKTYPEDYPKEGDEIIVEGRFGTYEELGIVYSQLEDARLL